MSNRCPRLVLILVSLEAKTTQTHSPVLVIKDRRYRKIWAHMLPSKGLEQPYGVKSLLRALTIMGYKRVILKSDQEPAIKALVAKAAAEWTGEAIPEISPKGESTSNGEIERAVQEVQGFARTL